MKRTLASIVIVGLAVAMAPSPTAAQANFFGQVTTGRILERGVQDVSGFVGFFDGSTTFFGQLRRGLSTDFEGGLQFGLIDPNHGDVGVALGGDLKFGMMKSTPHQPLDLALDARAAYFNLDEFSIFNVGGSIIISHPYHMSRGSTLTPYGAVNLRFERISSDRHSKKPLAAQIASHAANTSLEIAAMGGIQWDVSDGIDLLAELVIDDDMGLILGINFKL